MGSKERIVYINYYIEQHYVLSKDFSGILVIKGLFKSGNRSIEQYKGSDFNGIRIDFNYE